MNHLRRVLIRPRELNQFEKHAITKMITLLPNSHVLKTQMENAKVVSVCDCGCRTIDLTVRPNIDKYLCDKRVPVEMEVTMAGDPTPVLFLLHLVDGYLNELEILKLDSIPIDGEMDISKGTVLVRI